MDRLQTETDDGVRLWLNDAQVINNWTDHGPTKDTTAAITLIAGQRYDVTMEYYEKGGGAEARASWTAVTAGPETCAAGELRAEYFANRSLAGTPALVRCETAIDNDWGGGAPGSRHPPERLLGALERHPRLRRRPLDLHDPLRRRHPGPRGR